MCPTAGADRPEHKLPGKRKSKCAQANLQHHIREVAVYGDKHCLASALWHSG
jgi:hypothetical protein